jgi:hemin uptake protein HemP
MRFILICIKDETTRRCGMTGGLVATERTAAEPLRCHSSAGLLQGQRQVVIEHAGREYRLRLTALGKLILTA